MSEDIQNWIELFCRELRAEVGENTVRWHRDHLLAFGKERERIDTNVLTQWRVELATSGLSAWTQRGRVRAVKRFCLWLQRRGLLTGDFSFKLPRVPSAPPKAMRWSDLTTLLNHITTQANDGDRWAIRDRALLLFLADTGCRSGGLRGLTFEDLDLSRRRAIVREKGRGGPKARTVYFGAETKTALDLWIECRSKTNHLHLFTNRADKPLTVFELHRLLIARAKEVGIQGRCNPHSIRHLFAEQMIKNGADLSTVSHLMGHSNIKVTHDFYIRFNDDDLAERHQRFSRL